ncbi:MAG TPA: hypothetical protein VIX89_14220 [Bryobacteraceae bacterium]
MDTDSIVKLRVDGIKSSCERARLSFFVMLIASCAVMVAQYNDHLAWDNHLTEAHGGLREWPPPTPESRDPRDKRITQLAAKAEEQEVKNGVDNTTITIGLFGLRIGPSDLTLFGSLAMLVVSMYYCLCSRRASHDIESLLEDVQDTDLEVRKYVLVGVRQSLVLHMAVEEETVSSVVTKKQWPRTLRGLSSVYSSLTYLPSVAIGATVLADLWCAFLQRSEQYPDPFWWLLHLQRFYFLQYVTLDVLAIVTLLFVLSVNRLTNRFHNGTTSAMQRFVG